MRLYHSATSPYVRKVVVLLIETGQQGDVTLVPATGHPLDPGTLPLAQNPLGKVPCLERNDGPALYDSRVICRYLDARAGGRLYPPPPQLWDTLTLEATADGILDAAILMRYETHVRAADTMSPEWAEAQWKKVTRTVDAVEARWMAHLKGPPDMGHIALACALSYVDFRHGARSWRDGRPDLALWYAGFAARDSMVATAPSV
jgi:glutathione S-transferase